MENIKDRISLIKAAHTGQILEKSAPVIADTLAIVKEAQDSTSLQKAGWTQSGSAISGITAYDLDAPAKLLVPVLTPLRNRIPRVSANGGIQANWRAITGINTQGFSAGVTVGQRSGAITHTTADYFAAYRGLGLEDYVNFEADYAAQGFDDVKARAVDALLRSTMIQEEFVDLGGNTSVPLGTPTTPTVATATTGGAINTGLVVSVRVCALTLKGYQQLVGWNNGLVGQSFVAAGATLLPTISRSNMDSTTDVLAGGVSIASVGANVTTGAGTANSVTATVPPVAGAVAYAWFWGTVGSEVLGAVSTINSLNITTTPTGAGVTNASVFSADNSTDALVYDGMLTQIMKAGSGAYFKDLATGAAGVGTSLTTDGAGGINEIDAVFQDRWNMYRLSPDEMFVSASTLLLMNKLIIANGGAPLLRYTMDANNLGGGSIQAGVVVGSYLNKITGNYVKVTVHPNMPTGMIMFWSNSIPYPLSGVGNLVVKRVRRDYYQYEWPLRTRRYEYGVYFDGVLQNYFPPAFGVLRNINS